MIKQMRKKVLSGEITREEAEQMIGGTLEPKRMAKMWPTPTAMDIVDRKGMRPSRAATGRKTGYLSEEIQKQWPTPKGSKSGPDYARMNREGSGGDDLVTAVARDMWPTPRKSDHKGSGPVGSKSHKHMNERDYLCAVVKQWPTPMVQDSKGKENFPSQQHKKELAIVAGSGGQLNADWVEWLMGYAIGWTDIEREPGKVMSWETDPADRGEITRVITGQNNRAKRLKRLGNSIVPQCAELIFERLKEIG
jgi:hypothetical protein